MQSKHVEDKVEAKGKQAGAEEYAGGQREHPCEKDVAQRLRLQAGAVRRHRAGNARRQDMRRAYRQAKVIRKADCAHRDKFRRSSLRISQVRLTYFLADCHYDALPANHCSET